MDDKWELIGTEFIHCEPIGEEESQIKIYDTIRRYYVGVVKTYFFKKNRELDQFYSPGLNGERYILKKI